MKVRFAGRSQAQIERVLLESMKQFGAAAAARYQSLISAAIRLLQTNLHPPYVRQVNEEPDVKILHLKHANSFLPPGDRVGRPRHLILFRLADDGLLEILGLTHDRMQLPSAVRRARRDADNG